MHKFDDDKRFEYIYCHMMGVMVDQDQSIVNEFEGGACEALYEETFDARVKLSILLDGNEDGENKIVMEIVHAYEAMMKILCRRMYQYGLKDVYYTTGSHDKNDF